MHSDLHCTALRDATWKCVLGTNRSRGQQSFGFGVEQDEDSSSLGVLHEPRISRLEGPKPLLSNSDRMLQPSADLRMQDVRLPADSNLKRKLACVTLRRVPFAGHWCSLSAVHAPILSAAWTADPRLTTRASPDELISAGQSGHKRRIILSHCSSFWQNRRGREYSTDPSWLAKPRSPNKGIASLPLVTKHRYDNLSNWVRLFRYRKLVACTIAMSAGPPESLKTPLQRDRIILGLSLSIYCRRTPRNCEQPFRTTRRLELLANCTQNGLVGRSRHYGARLFPSPSEFPRTTVSHFRDSRVIAAISLTCHI